MLKLIVVAAVGIVNNIMGMDEWLMDKYKLDEYI